MPVVCATKNRVSHLLFHDFALCILFTASCSLAKYLVCTGLPDHKYLALFTTPLHNCHFQFTEPQLITKLQSIVHGGKLHLYYKHPHGGLLTYWLGLQLVQNIYYTGKRELFYQQAICYLSFRWVNVYYMDGQLILWAESKTHYSIHLSIQTSHLPIFVLQASVQECQNNSSASQMSDYLLVMRIGKC